MSVSPLQPEHANECLVLEPSFAANWDETRRWFFGISGVTATVAVGFALLGLWPVLAFACLELIGLAAGLYASARRSLDREVVSIVDEALAIEKGRGRPQQRWRFQRTWAEVVTAPPASRHARTALLVRSQGEVVELGGFLVERDRMQAAHELERLIGPMGAPGASRGAAWQGGFSDDIARSE